MSEHEELNPYESQDRLVDLSKLRVPFPPEQVSKLKKGYKDKRTGNWVDVELDYVGHADLTARLLDVDPLWNWEPLSMTSDGLPRMDHSKEGDPVGLWIKLTVCGVTRLGYGTCEEGKSEAVKELIGDALRNAAMRFGCALHLWSKAPTKSRPTAIQEATHTSAGSIRNNPPGQTREEETTDILEKAKDFFGGEEVKGSGSLVVLGCAVPPEMTDWATAEQYVLQFGKHKGRTLGSLTKDPDGVGYLEWMSERVATKIKDGKQKVYPGDWFMLVAYDQTLQGHAPIT